MRNKLVLTIAAIAFVIGIAGCSGSSSSGDAGGGSGGDAASVATLASVPTADLSSYDYSAVATAASASIVSKSANAAVSVTKEEGERLGANYGALGTFSRAGCELNMHKKEAIRMSQEVQFERCHFEAMEGGGLITIPVGSWNYYLITLPPNGAEEGEEMCEGIREENRRQACLEEMDEGGIEILAARIGRFGDNGSELRIDVCEGRDNESLVKESEATYNVSGATHTGTVVRIGDWMGEEERMEFGISVTGASIENGIADLGSTGTASAEGRFQGAFGSGRISFAADGATRSNAVSGAFAANFTDPDGVSNDFTGRTYGQFGGSTNTGTAKFSFSGTMPAESIGGMARGGSGVEDHEGIPDDRQDDYRQFMGEELGVEINEANMDDIKVCPNNDFDPNDPDSRGMILAVGDTCTHSDEGVESFSINNVANAGDRYLSIEQSFIIILNSASAYYDLVNPYDLASINIDPGTIAFSRSDWNCEAPADGWTLEINPDEMFDGNFPEGLDPDSINPEEIDRRMAVCDALDEQLRESDGMGGYDCAGEEMAGDAGDDFGGGGPAGREAGDTQGGMIPLPCEENDLGPEACQDYCDANADECFGEAGGPPDGGEVVQACLDIGITGMNECGEYCQSHDCFQ